MTTAGLLLVASLLRALSGSVDGADPPGSAADRPPAGGADAHAAPVQATSCRDQAPASASIRIGDDHEPGERLLVSGRVLGAGGAPLAGASVYVFHTDAQGYYSANHGMDNTRPRLCGVLRTDGDGRYHVQTVRPGRYATGGPPPHVHFEVWSEGAPAQRFEVRFDVRPGHGGEAEAAGGNRAAEVRPLVQDARGAWHLVRDLRMR